MMEIIQTEKKFVHWMDSLETLFHQAILTSFEENGFGSLQTARKSCPSVKDILILHKALCDDLTGLAPNDVAGFAHIFKKHVRRGLMSSCLDWSVHMFNTFVDSKNHSIT